MKISSYVGNILKGKYLIEGENRNHYWGLILLMAGVFLISILSSNAADQKIVRLEKLKDEIEDLKSNFLETRNLLNEKKNVERITLEANKLGLEKVDKPIEVLEIVNE